MKLLETTVTLYRNFVDSTPVEIAPDITCLVGKNESGKTAFLEALSSLKPASDQPIRLDITADYPRWRKVKDARRSDLEDVVPIEVIFELEEHEIERINKLLNFPLPSSVRLVCERTYQHEVSLSLDLQEEPLISELISQSNLDKNSKEQFEQAKTLQELNLAISARLDGIDQRTKEAQDLIGFRDKGRKAAKAISGNLSDEIIEAFWELVPTFFYFSQYSQLPGRIDLTRLLSEDESQLSDSDRTSRSLLNLVGVEGPEFMESNFENRVAELESAANEISNQVFEYWKTNQDIKVDLVGDPVVKSTPEGQTVVHRFLDIRLDDLRHHMTTNFVTRSTGFQWFFSFIIAFTEFEEDTNVVILLDEPGLGLHAKAQEDLLDFIEERLAPNNQVIYTTHSPFMVNPKHLERARLVEDLTSKDDPDLGAKISIDVLEVKGDTLFPLQAALGYDIAQNLFIAANNLIVEGSSDLVYLEILSDFLEDRGGVGLDKRFTITPVGGSDKIPTFVALLGTHLDVTVLIDSTISTHQKLENLIVRGIFNKKQLISINEIVGVSNASIEDLFTPGEYLKLYRDAFSVEYKVADLKGKDSIISRLERHRGSEFSHLRPASILLRQRDTYLPGLSEGTLERFQTLFKKLNATLPTE